jgi:nitroreductase / dihydropteridine reductase
MTLPEITSLSTRFPGLSCYRDRLMNTFLSNLEWRNATKAFDTTQKVSAEHLGNVLTAIQMAPTSFGLQPFIVDVIESADVKAQISPFAWHQKQITTCSHLLVFSARLNAKARIDQYFAERSGNNASVRENFKEYEGMMNGALGSRSPAELHSWAAKQAYIALGFAMAACAELQLDSCPMEGFDPNGVDKVLAFDSETKSAALLAIGYRDAAVPPMPKFRFSQSNLIRRR